MSENKKTVIMAFVCNPYVALMQKRLYLKYWKDEVDEVLINVNGRNDKIRNWIAKLWGDDDKVKFVDNINLEKRQGLAFDRLYPKVTGRILITLDSDNFIFKKGVITRYCDLILNGEYSAVGSIGYHAYPSEVADIALEKYGTVRLNPFMSFWDMNVLKTIDNVTFKTYNYKAGERFGPLGTIPKDGWMDIMARFTLEYFAKSPKYLKISTSLLGEYTHVGAISSHYRRFFRSLEDTNTQEFQMMSNKNYQMYYRGWHSLIYQQTRDEVPFPEYNKQYEKGWQEQLEKLKIKPKDVDQICVELTAKHKDCFI